MTARATSYDAYYFAHACGRPYQRDDEWLQFFDGIAEHIVRELHPQSVLDAGCAMGFLVEGLRRRAVDAFGLDLSEYAISHVHPDMAPYCKLGSVTDKFSRHYDLVVCIEVLEHLMPGESEQALLNFCQHTNSILFSSTPHDYKEATHFNVQPPDYWAERFARHGFIRDLDFDASFITPWAISVRRSDVPVHRIVRDYERRLWFLSQENRGLRSLTLEMRNELSANEASAANRSDSGKPATPGEGGSAGHTQDGMRDGSDAESERLHAENEYWKGLATRYAQGRLMRLMAWLHGVRESIGRLSEAK
jgi:SAM-dependent methyltransferase